MLHSPKKTPFALGNGQQGKISAWVILPWLLFFVLAFVFWWFVTMRPAEVPLLPNAPAAAEMAPLPKAAPEGEGVWQPELAAPSVETAPTGDAAPAVSSYHDAVSRAAVSVVNIYTTQNISSRYQNDPHLRLFLEQYGYRLPESGGDSSLGSGVIVSADGYIITNAHVIERADEITVALNDGRKARANIIGRDPESDLAVIKVDLDNLTPLAFRQTPIRVGDVALAIGNPFGVGQTVTQGIVSATGRSGLGVNTFEDFIQTDAAINPGNSGGALVDAHGALIGINTVIYSRSGGSMGIGFAIPTAIVEQVMNGLISTGKVSRGWLGVEIGRTINDPTDLSRSKGVIVAGVFPDGPAAKAGLQVGDVVLRADGADVTDANALVQRISKKAPNSSMTLEIERAGVPMTIEVILAERPSLGRQN